MLYFITNCFSVKAWIADWINASPNRLPGPWGVPVLGYLPFLDPKVLSYHILTLSFIVGKRWNIISLIKAKFLI